MKTDGAFTMYEDDAQRRGGAYGSEDSTHDFALAALSLTNASGTIASAYDSTHAGNLYVRFQESITGSNAPFEHAFYYDIQHGTMDQASIDSVCGGVQNVATPLGSGEFATATGTVVTTSAGDLDEDGFNEREGAYIVAASGNGINIKVPAASDRCRFNPAFRVTGYGATFAPPYVVRYDARDTIRLTDGTSMNMHFDEGANEVLLQLAGTFCDTFGLWVDDDEDLAVTLSSFYGRPGDRCDSLFWVTESESHNLGFMLYRRVCPLFFDSLAATADTASASPAAPGEAGRLLKAGHITARDTGLWLQLTETLIPGASRGVSHGPRRYRFIDERGLYNDVVYEYRLVAIDNGGEEEQYESIRLRPRRGLPGRFRLLPCYPNPFRRVTAIRFSLPVRARVSLDVYNLQGRLVARLLSPERWQNPGLYRVVWNGTGHYGHPLGAGPYICRLVAADARRRFSSSRLMILVK
jgi:hypothetical protein